MKNSDEKRLLVKRNIGELGRYHLTALSPRDLSEIRDETFVLSFLHPREDINFNCCEGLLCIYQVSGHIYLCNPTTKQFQFFPTEEISPFFKLRTTLVGACVCYDSKSDDYKIVRVCQSINRRTYETFELYSLGENSWTEVRSPRREGDCLFDFKAIPVGGKCYWFARGGDLVASFDCIKESFSYFDLPPNSRRFSCNLVQFNGGDSLGLVRIQKYEPGCYYELWVWKEDLLLWNREFTVSLGGAVTVAQGTIYGTYFFLRGIAGKPDKLNHRLVVYDWNKKDCHELGIENYHFENDVFCYVESTVVLPHGNTIYGSNFLNYPRDTVDDMLCYPPSVNKEDEDEDDMLCYPLFVEEEEEEEEDEEEEDEDEDENEYEYKNEIEKLALDDFYANGFRILNDIAKEERKKKKVETNGNMPSVYKSAVYAYKQSSFYPYEAIAPNLAAFGAKILSEGGVNMGTGEQHSASSVTCANNGITSEAAPTPQIIGPQGLENKGESSNTSLLDGECILHREREAKLHSVDELKISGLNIFSVEPGSGHTMAVSNKTKEQLHWI